MWLLTYDQVEPAVTVVTNEPVEVQDYCRRITGRLRGIYRVYPDFMKENCEHVTDRLDLQTLRGSQPDVMPKNLPDHWC